MALHDEDLEKQMDEKGLNAPRVTIDGINDKIVSAEYYRFPETTVTVCLIKLVNGFSVIGESAAASPENFDEELGRQIAYDKAFDKIWAFEGYLLRERLHSEQ